MLMMEDYFQNGGRMGFRVNPHKLRVGCETRWESQQWCNEGDQENLDLIAEESDSHTSYAENC